MMISLSKLFTIYECNGDDATTFLNGQLTTDTLNLPVGEAFLSCILNPRGRIITTLFIIKININNFILFIPNQSSNIILHLQKFIMRSKVKFTLKDDLSLSFTEDKTNDTYLINYSNNMNINYYFSITEHAHNSSNNLDNWKEFVILNKLPIITNTTSECFIPQNLSLDDIPFTLCYTKGCYVGQEIVARTHYLGKSKQSLFKFNTKDLNIITGTSVTAQNLDHQNVGMIVETLVQQNILIGLVSLYSNCITDAFVNNNSLNIEV